MGDLCAWLASNSSSCLEAVGFVSGALCVWLVTRESMWNWPLAIVTSISYAAVFARAGLYSDSGLQGVYLVLSVYGWWHWSRGHSALPLTVTNTPRAQYLPLVAIGVVMWLVFWGITARLPGTRAPLLDSALVATSLLAQWLMTRKHVENWLLWIAVDVVYIGLYFSRGLRLTAVLYAVYLVLATLGLLEWKRSLRRTGMLSPASS